MVPGPALPGHPAPLPSSECPSACQLLAPLLVAECHLSLQTPPNWSHMALCPFGTGQLQMGCQNPRKGHGRQWLRDLGEGGKVFQRWNL